MAVFIFKLDDDRKERLRQDAERTGVSMSDYMRRLMDYGSQERVKNEMFPHMSGSFQGVR